MCMNKNTVTRKKRSDRLHVIYMLQSGSDCYVGITAKTAGTINKSVLVRFNKHIYRSRTENKNWLLYHTMRERGAESFVVVVIDVVRGKQLAHDVERKLIQEHRPNLNTALPKEM